MYVTVDDVDASEGPTWSWEKDRCVLEANTWLTTRLANAIVQTPLPSAILTAGILLALDAAECKLYTAVQPRVTSITVSADQGLNVSRKFADAPHDAPQTARMAMVEDLLSRWTRAPQAKRGVFFLGRV